MKNRLTVGVMIGNANSPYTIELMHGIEAMANEKDINIVFFVGIHNDNFYASYFGADNNVNRAALVNSVYDFEEMLDIDAYIISAGTMSIFMSEAERQALYARISNKPYLLLEESTDPSLNQSSLISDNYQGTYDLMSHLVLEHDYKNFLYLAGPKSNTDATQRLKAFHDVMTSFDLPHDESRVAYGDFSSEVAPQINQLLDHHPDADALVCANDMMADTAYIVLRKRGLEPGKDIAVAGYDNWIRALYMIPSLTTVNQNAYEMGTQSVETILDLIEHGGVRNIVIPAEPIFRESCGAAFDNRVNLHDNEDLLNLRKLLDQQIHHYMTYEQETWLLPLISSDMTQALPNREAFFRKSLTKMYGLQIEKSMLYVYDEPIVMIGNRLPSHHEKLYLATKQVKDDVVSYKLGEQPVLDFKSDIHIWNLDEDGERFYVFSVHSGNTLFGMLMLKIKPAQIPTAYLISMQIANSLQFYMMARENLRIRKAQEKLLEELNEKNKILSFISDHDVMTNCLNRRGFMEQLMRFIKVFDGQPGLLFFADLDHLKMINDQYGHGEGDFAIIQASKILEEAFDPFSHLLGRTGGDEYICVAAVSSAHEGEDFIREVKSRCRAFNASSDKPYYLEITMGFVSFTFSETLNTSHLMYDADQMLYIEKKNRRQDITK